MTNNVTPHPEHDSYDDDLEDTSEELVVTGATPKPAATPAATIAATQPATGDEALIHTLENLYITLANIELPLPTPTVADDRTLTTSVRDQIADYVLPRLREIDAPLLVVVGGSTGAGKSTLVNSLLRAEITTAGALRPTTRNPILIHHPGDAHWFRDQRILSSLPRLSSDAMPADDDISAGAHPRAIRLVPHHGVPRGMALLDAPDIDSVVSENRELASQLLAAADLWLFVTTAARYADALPWEYLKQAGERGASVAVILDRVPAEAMHEVRSDLARLLAEGPLAAAPLFAIEEVQLIEGLVPDDHIEPIWTWLTELAVDAAARHVVARRTVRGAVASVSRHLDSITAGATAQVQAVERLIDTVEESFTESREALRTALADGTLMRGEVLSRWHDFLGTGDFARGLESKIALIRDQIISLFSRRAPADPLGAALHSGVTEVLLARTEQGASRVRSAWQRDPVGQYVLDADPSLSAPGENAEARAQRIVRDWQKAVFDLVKEQAQEKKTTARILAIGVNTLGVVLMVVVFAGTAFVPTGLEVATAVGTATVGQRLLESIFGEDAVRRLAKEAHSDLVSRTDDYLTAEKLRFVQAINDLDVDMTAPGTLAASAEELKEVDA